MAQTTSRRSFIGASAAATIATAGPVTAAVAAVRSEHGDDPVFALIEREHQVMAVFEEVFDETGRLQEALYALKRENKGDTEAAAELRRAVEEAEERQSEALDELDDALLGVTSATPTTAAGLFAMMDLFWARERDFFTDSIEANLEGIYAAVRAIVGRQA